MKRSLVLVTVLLILLAILVLPAMAITWGEEDGNEHPNVALISRPDPGNEDHQRPFCSGTLIDEKVLLTAGHCTIFLEDLIAEGELTVELGFEQHALKAGDSIIFDSALPHRLSNTGDTRMRAVWVVMNASPQETLI